MNDNKSKRQVIFLILVLLFVLVFFRLVSTPSSILSWDVFGYYLYLPAKFIHHDLTLQNQVWITELINKYEPTATLYQAIKLDNGNWVMKYSLGMSIFYFPFFMIAHGLALIFNLPADGLSPIYQYTLAIGGIFIAIVGLIFLIKVLQQFFSTRLSVIITLLIVFGTNYFQLTTFEGTLLSHNILFTLYAILAYYSINWHQKQKLKYMVFIGLTCGLCTLVRPSEIVCLLIPLFWNIYNKESLLLKLNLIKGNYFQVLISGFAFALVLLPQILYWKSVTGEYLFYSYTNPGEGFDFATPYIKEFLFSFRKGWLIYTPLMFFSFYGFYFLYKKNKNIVLAILVFIILDLYIISSWSCWWYAGASYSSRSIVPAYVLLAIPLGYFVENIKSQKTFIKYSIVVIISFFVILNLFQTWQFENGIITRGTMTKDYYFAIFGRTKVPPEANKFLLVNRFADENELFKSENDYSKKVIYEENFDNNNDTSSQFKGCFLMNESIPYSPGLDMKYKDLTSCDHAWIRMSADIIIMKEDTVELPLIVIHFLHKDGTYKYATKGPDKSKLRFNELIHLEMDYLTPEVRSVDDNFKAYIWYRGKGRIYIDKIRIEAFEPKNQLQ